MQPKTMSRGVLEDMVGKMGKYSVVAVSILGTWIFWMFWVTYTSGNDIITHLPCGAVEISGHGMQGLGGV